MTPDERVLAAFDKAIMVLVLERRDYLASCVPHEPEIPVEDAPCEHDHVLHLATLGDRPPVKMCKQCGETLDDDGEIEDPDA